MERLWQDLQFGIRSFAKNPGFTTVAVLALTLESALTVPSSAWSMPFCYGHCHTNNQTNWSSFENAMFVSGNERRLSKLSGLARAKQRV